MNIVTISEADIEKAVVKEAGLEGMTVDAGPGPMVEIFGESRQSRLEVDVWKLLPKVGLTDEYFQERCEWAIWDAIKCCREDILRLVEQEKRVVAEGSAV